MQRKKLLGMIGLAVTMSLSLGVGSNPCPECGQQWMLRVKPFDTVQLAKAVTKGTSYIVRLESKSTAKVGAHGQGLSDFGCNAQATFSECTFKALYDAPVQLTVSAGAKGAEGLLTFAPR